MHYLQEHPHLCWGRCFTFITSGIITTKTTNNNMAHLSEIYIKTDVLETLLKTVKAKGEKGLSITISSNDDPGQYGQNLWAYVSQSKEDREAKKPRFTVGWGKNFWSDGKPPFVPEKPQAASPTIQDAKVVDDGDELPF
ncbi:MAG TPA: hypothetical protein VIC51_12405 [Psychromonas sp.]